MKRNILVLLVTTLFLWACGGDISTDTKDAEISVALFIPGVLAGSPTYEMMNEGVKKAAQEKKNVKVRVVEGGYNQAEWQSQVTALAATKEYDFIMTTNPAMPEICAEVRKNYPNQKFLIWDGYLEGNKGIVTVQFNDRELAYIMGYLARLITQAQLKGTNPDLKVGLIAGQEYPVMNQAIKPGFEQGMLSLGAGVELDFRVIGNWYDATKATELANSMFDSGVDVILPIAGGANQGVVSAAKERGAYVLWYNTDGYSIQPGIVAGSGLIRADKAAYDWTKQAFEGTLEWGTATTVGVKDGYIDLITNNSQYKKIIPKEAQSKLAELLQRMKSGELVLEMPKL